MQDAVTEHIRASPEAVWGTGRGRHPDAPLQRGDLRGRLARRRHRAGGGHAVPGARATATDRGPKYWTTCRVAACEPGREFGFEVVVGGRSINNWHYRFEPAGDGTDVTESFRLTPSAGRD